MEVFGSYRLEAFLGRGGMGEVWRAYDAERDRTVALKRLAPHWADVPTFRERFRREAAAVATLCSPHVVPLHDHGEIDGRLFLAMPLVGGGDLAGVLREHPDGLGVDRAVDLVAQIADGLDAAHRRGLVHRDVKPSNVLLDGSTPDRAYLVDFGLVAVAGAVAAGSVAPGTPAYMAPELFAGTRPTPGTDVYALGCVLFEMLTGRRAVVPATVDQGDATLDPGEPVAPVWWADPPAPSSLRAELAPFDAVLARALANDPDRRHPDVTALVADARAAAGGQGGG